MKLSKDRSSPHYHDAGIYIDKVLVNGVEVRHCIEFDTEVGATCYKPSTDPFSDTLATEMVLGKVDIVWRIGGRIRIFLQQDWEVREGLLPTPPKPKPKWEGAERRKMRIGDRPIVKQEPTDAPRDNASELLTLGVVVFHTAGNIGFKQTLGSDGAKGALPAEVAK
jgi:hypothetical protein